MKKLVLLLLFFAVTSFCSAQFKNLGKKFEKKVKDRVERKIDRTMDKGLDKAENEVDETTRGNKKNKDNSNQEGNNNGDNPGQLENGDDGMEEVDEPMNFSESFVANTKFDFVPGNKLMVTENFERDNIGDFPANWDTNGGGEIVTIGDDGVKWFKLLAKSTFIPDLPKTLPEEYTIEFDMIVQGVDRQTSSQAYFHILLDDNNGFKDGRNWARVRLPLVQYIAQGIHVSNHRDGERVIYNDITADIRNTILNKPHISIAVNKTRIRLWVNEKKYVDVPRLVPANSIKYLKFYPFGMRDQESVFIANVKVAEGGLDLRSKLISEGRVSTNGILFDVNSAKVRPESYGVIREIALAMKNNENVNVQIIGHTDSDGDADSNLALSKSRAAAVKQILSSDYQIAASRLTVDGKGESEPLVGNDTPENKASNRRVDFVVIK